MVKSDRIRVSSAGFYLMMCDVFWAQDASNYGNKHVKSLNTRC